MMAFVPAAEHSHRCRSGRAVITSCLGCDLKMKCVCVCAVKAEVSLWSASGIKLISVFLPGPTDFTLG